MTMRRTTVSRQRIRIREVRSPDDPALVRAHRLLRRAMHSDELVTLTDWRHSLAERVADLWTTPVAFARRGARRPDHRDRAGNPSPQRGHRVRRVPRRRPRCPRGSAGNPASRKASDGVRARCPAGHRNGSTGDPRRSEDRQPVARPFDQGSARRRVGLQVSTTPSHAGEAPGAPRPLLRVDARQRQPPAGPNGAPNSLYGLAAGVLGSSAHSTGRLFAASSTRWAGAAGSVRLLRQPSPPSRDGRNPVEPSAAPDGELEARPIRHPSLPSAGDILQICRNAVGWSLRRPGGHRPGLQGFAAVSLTRRWRVRSEPCDR